MTGGPLPTTGVSAKAGNSHTCLRKTQENPQTKCGSMRTCLKTCLEDFGFIPSTSKQEKQKKVRAFSVRFHGSVMFPVDVTFCVDVIWRISYASYPDQLVYNIQMCI